MLHLLLIVDIVRLNDDLTSRVRLFVASVINTAADKLLLCRVFLFDRNAVKQAYALLLIDRCEAKCPSITKTTINHFHMVAVKLLSFLMTELVPIIDQ